MEPKRLALIGAAAVPLLLLWRRRRLWRLLDVVHVPAKSETGKPAVVLIPGMWHGAWFFEALQQLLADRGFASYAIDLQPGRCIFAADHLAMLSRTLDQLALKQAVFLGHSQGGILLQRLMRDYVPQNPSCMLAAVLSATVPISSVGAGTAMMNEKTNVFKEYGFVALLFYLFTGRMWDSSLVQRIFLLPTTESISLPGGKEGYVKRLLAAPCDGWPTTEHPFWLRPSFPAMRHKPVLLLGAEADVIYPPKALNPYFRKYFAQAEELVVPGQAHCFVDPGWEETMAKPLLRWLESLAH
ncbi:unnamed protein product [Effrenium voratum]|nr:unnamed protein product [Effrenium voratum]